MSSLKESVSGFQGPAVADVIGGRPPALPSLGWLVPTVVRFAAALLLFAVGAVLFRLADPARSLPPAWAVILWTTLVAIVLWSVRGRLDHLADRLRFGGDAEGYDSMRQLLQRMSTTLPVDEVIPALAESLGRSAHSSRTEVRIELDDGERWSQVWPPAAPVRGEPLTIEIRHLGDAVGELEFDAVGPSGSERRLLDQISGQAGLAMSTVRLTWSLRRRVGQLQLRQDQLRSSQARLVEARVAAQRRLQAEVDDRVMPHLRAVDSVIAESRIAIEQGRPVQGLKDAARRLSQALDTLRSIARGIYPPRLDEAGLQVCLEAWRDSAGAPLTVAVNGDAGRLRAVPQIETCLYFCLVTALQSVLVSAQAMSVEVGIGESEAGFLLEVSGVDRFPELTAIAVEDRLGAFDGSWELHSQESSVLVTGRLPMAGEDGQIVGVGVSSAAAEQLSSS